MEQIRAANPGEAFWTLEPFAVVAPDDPWHCDIDALLPREHYGVVAQLTRRLTPRRPTRAHVSVR